MSTVLLSFDSKLINSQPARAIRYQKGILTVHADSNDTAGQFALIEMRGSTGGEPPLHVHRNEDELFFVIEGHLKVLRGSEELTLNPGQSGFLPRGLPHTFKIVSPQARFLVYISPGGFEEYFRDCGKLMSERGASEPAGPVSIAEMIRLAGRYSVTFMP